MWNLNVPNKVNFDGFVINNHHAAAGLVVRVENDTRILVGARSLGENTVNVAECVGLGDVHWMARSPGVSEKSKLRATRSL